MPATWTTKQISSQVRHWRRFSQRIRRLKWLMSSLRRMTNTLMEVPASRSVQPHQLQCKVRRRMLASACALIIDIKCKPTYSKKVVTTAAAPVTQIAHRSMLSEIKRVRGRRWEIFTRLTFKTTSIRLNGPITWTSRSQSSR
jgi:hypothetical protein